jgi:hypothetical protein
MDGKKKGERFNKFPAQSLIEFALVLPILLLLIFGAIDFGRMFFIKIALTNAAREGANYLAWHPEEVSATNFVNMDLDDDTIEAVEAVIKAEAESLGIEIDFANEVTITKTCLELSTCSGGEIEVQITKPYDFILGNLLAALGLADSPLTLASRIRMVVQ